MNYKIFKMGHIKNLHGYIYTRVSLYQSIKITKAGVRAIREREIGR